MTSYNPRWWWAGNLKPNIGDKQILFCLTLKYLQNLKEDSLSYNLRSICFKSGGFLEKNFSRQLVPAYKKFISDPVAMRKMICVV